MKYRLLGKTGMDISVVAYGVSPVGGVFGAVAESEGIAALHRAIDLGINYFDVAPMYGETLAETRLGKAMKGKRDKVFLATKCCRYSETAFDFSAKRVRASIDESLARLQTDYVDVFQVHDIEFGDKKQVLEEAIPAALEAKRAGKARFVGITGLPVRYLRHIAEQVAIDTILSWAHYDLLDDEMDVYLTPFCRERGIGLINASPLHQRLLTEKGPPAWHRSPKEVLELVPKVAAFCRSRGVDIADVAMRYSLDHPTVATTIVGMSKVSHVESNIRALDLKIDPALMREVVRMLEPVKNRMWFEGKPENNLPPSAFPNLK
jgi:L-galactose dehydrogenase